MERSISLKELQQYIRSTDHRPELTHHYVYKLMEEVGELAQAIRKDNRMGSTDNIKGTVEEELYDVLYYVLALANVYDVDLELCYRLKQEINAAKYEKKVMYDGKYLKLYEHLSRQDESVSSLTLTFREIEEILQFKLPDSAYTYHAWWANEKHTHQPQKLAWQNAGWKTVDIKLGVSISFVRNS